jgi:hypothetical protein
MEGELKVLPRSARYLLTVIWAIAFLFMTSAAGAESVVTVDKSSLTYAYRVGVNLDDLAKQAALRCAEIGGVNCETMVQCSDRGFGAVAMDAAGRKIGAVCGKPDEASARSEATANCVAAGGDQSGCKVTGIYHDKTPVFPVPRSYFAGDWSANCGGKQIYRFKFVAFNEFQASSCSCRVGVGRSCQLWRCAPVKGTYTPGQPDGRFVSPTFSKTLTITDNRLSLQSPNGQQNLHQCR